MHHLAHFLLAAGTSTTTTKKKSGSSFTSDIFLLVIVAFGLFYFLYLRPKQNKARSSRTTGTTFAVGDEVISAGGILGTVTHVVGDEVVVEVSPGQTLTFWKRAVNLRTSVKGAPQSSAVDEVDDDEGGSGQHQYDNTGADSSDWREHIEDDEESESEGDWDDEEPVEAEHESSEDEDDEQEASTEAHDADGGTDHDAGGQDDSPGARNA